MAASFLARALDVKDRVKQVALEVSGLSVHAAEPPIPELVEYGKQDEQLRVLYKSADNYIQRMNAMCEASTKLAEVLDLSVAAHPALKAISTDFVALQTCVNREHLALLGQMMHRKLFKPIRAEIEARKALDASVAEHKRYKGDFEAYKRRMRDAVEKEPARREQIGVELAAAQSQYDSRTKAIIAETAAAMEARTRILCKGMVAFVTIQHVFFHGTEEALATMLDRARTGETGAADFRGISIVALLDQTVADCKAVREHIAARLTGGGAPEPPPGPGGGSPVPQRPAGSSAPPHMGAQQQQQQQQPQMQRPPQQQPQPPAQQPQRQPSLLDPPPASGNGGGGDVDLLGGFASPTPQHAPGVVGSGGASGGLLGGGSGGGGFGLPPPPAPMQPSQGAPSPPPPSGADLLGSMGFGPSQDDLFFSSLGGGGGSGASGAGGSGGNSGVGGMGGVGGGDLMGGMGGGGGGGGGGLDDMMAGFGAPQSLTPPPGDNRNSSNNLSSAHDDPFGGAFGAPLLQPQPSGGGGLAPPPGSAAYGSNSSARSAGGGGGANLMDGFGGGMGGLGMGGGGGGGGSGGANSSAGLTRDQLKLQREQETAEAMQATVSKQREQRQAQEAERDEKRTIASQVKAKVDNWRQGKKNMRAILSTLHEIVPPGTQWEPVGLAKLLQASDVKKAYRKALLVIHTDKLPETATTYDTVLAQEVFDALREAWASFQHEL